MKRPSPLKFGRSGPCGSNIRGLWGSDSRIRYTLSNGRERNGSGSACGGPPANPLYYKNTLRPGLKWCRIRAPRQIKGRAWGVAPPQAPMRETYPPTQQYITAPTPIIAEKLLFYKGALCLYICGVGFLYPAPLSVCLDGKATGGREGKYHPQGPYH